MEFRASTEKGAVTSEVKINPARSLVNGRTVFGMKEGEDRAIYLLNKEGGEVRSVPIRSPKRYR